MASTKAQKVTVTASRLNQLIKAVDTLDCLYQKGMVEMKPGTYQNMISAASYASAEVARQTKRRGAHCHIVTDQERQHLLSVERAKTE